MSNAERFDSEGHALIIIKAYKTMVNILYDKPHTEGRRRLYYQNINFWNKDQVLEQAWSYSWHKPGT